MSDRDDKEIDKVTGMDTTGHEWDGIKELNSPLPRWWLWCFYGTIVWAVAYTIAYPAWPMISGATTGLLGYSTRAEVARNIEVVETANADLTTRLANVELASLTDDPDLNRFAIQAGSSVFRTNCSQCHGSGAAGGIGYPNLLDDDWLWGGDIENIALTIRHGIRNEADPDARWTEMPAYGEIFTTDDVASVVAHVQSISGQDHDAALATTGAELFLDNCAACHGDAGLGNPELGAPNLTDAIWLYGGEERSLSYTVENARFGIMPPWTPRLSDAEINAVAAYVHQLGGGE